MSIKLPVLPIIERILNLLSGFRAAIWPLLCWDSGKPMSAKTTTVRLLKHSGTLVTNWAFEILVKSISSRHFPFGGVVHFRWQNHFSIPVPQALEYFHPQEVTGNDDSPGHSQLTFFSPTLESNKPTIGAFFLTT